MIEPPAHQRIAHLFFIHREALPSYFVRVDRLLVTGEKTENEDIYTSEKLYLVEKKLTAKKNYIDASESEKPEIQLLWPKLYYNLWIQSKPVLELLSIESTLPFTVNYAPSPVCGISAYWRGEVITREAGAKAKVFMQTGSYILFNTETI